jgi:hypothetical protein
MSFKQNQNIKEILKEIIESLNDLKYGEIKITVHNSRIVQIDKTEKTRLEDVRVGEEVKT